MVTAFYVSSPARFSNLKSSVEILIFLKAALDSMDLKDFKNIDIMFSQNILSEQTQEVTVS